MGIFVKEKQAKRITIDGTDKTLASVYLVAEFMVKHDGKTVEAALYPFASREMYGASKGIHTDVPTTNLYIVLDDATPLTLVELYTQLGQHYVDTLGYDVDVETSNGLISLQPKP